MQAELLDRLKAMPVLADCRLGIPEIDSWPFAFREEMRSCYVEYARITQRFPLQWRYSKQDDVDRVVSICQETGAKLTIHCSPATFPVNGMGIYNAIKPFRKRWGEIMRMIAGRVPVDKVFIDSEKMSYVRPATTPSHRANNAILTEFNSQLYDWTHRCTRCDRIGWYGHLASRRWAIDNGLDSTKFEAYTNSDTPDCLGFGISAYNPADLHGTITDLRRQIANASLFQCTTGTIWLPLGHSQTWEQVPGIETFPHLTGEQYVYPYDSNNSHFYGRMVVDNDWPDQRSFGLSQRGGRFIPAERVQHVVFWQGVFDEDTDATSGPHFIAFANGLQGLEFDESLREWQARLWKAANLDNTPEQPLGTN